MTDPHKLEYMLQRLMMTVSVLILLPALISADLNILLLFNVLERCHDLVGIHIAIYILL